MEYIETFHRQVDGNNITQKYLNEKCVVTESGRQVYRNVNYSNTFRPDYANEMSRVLGDVQHDLCCYCMRLLPKGSKLITLEHIIPQSSSSEEFDRYTTLGYDELSIDNLIHTDKFSGTPTSATLPPLPHTVAYHNFLISCNGSFVPENYTHLCCNNARKEKFIVPVFFNPSIAEEIEYTPEGKVQAKKTATHKAHITAFISAARLNDKTLQEIRFIWYRLRHTELTAIAGAINDRKMKTLLLLKNCDNSTSLKTKYAIHPYKWELLLSYSWFHNYYRAHYK